MAKELETTGTAPTTAGGKSAPVLYKIKHMDKSFGPTHAVDGFSFDIHKGDVVGLVGSNGAGKSTLMRLISGVIPCDHGALTFRGEDINTEQFSVQKASEVGIRVVHQELSLCKNLSVYENFYLEQAMQLSRGFGWRKKALALAKAALDEVFPEHGVDVRTKLSNLSITQQQMVEIARAASDPTLKLLILDEPTSSLPEHQTGQLKAYIQRKSKEGVSFIFISHRLSEIIQTTSVVCVMQNGKLVWSGPTTESSEDALLEKMGGGAASAGLEKPKSEEVPKNSSISVRCENLSTRALSDISFSAEGGEIVCIEGLEGSGQLDLLHEIYAARGARNKKTLQITGKVSYVAGDRKKEGIFPLWSVFDNMIVGRAAQFGLLRKLPEEALRGFVDNWFGLLAIKSDGSKANITSLSGGNQQKVLIARTMVAESDIILLDDPTRGVDVSTKQQLYELFREVAALGKLILWRSSEAIEREQCTRTLVMSFGRIAADLPVQEATDEAVLAASFSNSTEKKAQASTKRMRVLNHPLVIPFAALAIIYILYGLTSPAVFSKFGVELLVSGFSPLIFAALAQTFIIGLGHIDLGMGAFMGLVNVLCATVLFERPFLGLLLLLAALLVYSLQGLLIYERKIPPIIVTLGMSYVWLGLAYTLLEAPGGQTPGIIVKIATQRILGFSSVTLLCVAAAFASILFYRSRYGTVLRGMGNNEGSMRNSGWSCRKAYITVYAVSGLFALLGGMLFSGITGSADANASSSYTMLTIASVILGGGHFSGGIVFHLGSVIGAASLSLINALLGAFKVNTDFTAAIQGLLLIVVLALRLVGRKSNES